MDHMTLCYVEEIAIHNKPTESYLCELLHMSPGTLVWDRKQINANVALSAGVVLVPMLAKMWALLTVSLSLQLITGAPMWPKNLLMQL